jgi:hypothetical protein
LTDIPDVFEGHLFAVKHLTPALIRIYVDVEFTGRTSLPLSVCSYFSISFFISVSLSLSLVVSLSLSLSASQFVPWSTSQPCCTGHAQFYEKFLLRRYITLLLKYLRTLPGYKEALLETTRYPHLLPYLSDSLDPVTQN